MLPFALKRGAIILFFCTWFNEEGDDKEHQEGKQQYTAADDEQDCCERFIHIEWIKHIEIHADSQQHRP